MAPLITFLAPLNHSDDNDDDDDGAMPPLTMTTKNFETRNGLTTLGRQALDDTPSLRASSKSSSSVTSRVSDETSRSPSDGSSNCSAAEHDVDDPPPHMRRVFDFIQELGNAMDAVTRRMDKFEGLLDNIEVDSLRHQEEMRELREFFQQDGCVALQLKDLSGRLETCEREQQRQAALSVTPFADFEKASQEFLQQHLSESLAAVVNNACERTLERLRIDIGENFGAPVVADDFGNERQLSSLFDREEYSCTSVTSTSRSWSKVHFGNKAKTPSSGGAARFPRPASRVMSTWSAPHVCSEPSIQPLVTNNEIHVATSADLPENASPRPTSSARFDIGLANSPEIDNMCVKADKAGALYWAKLGSKRMQESLNVQSDCHAANPMLSGDPKFVGDIDRLAEARPPRRSRHRTTTCS